MTRTTLYQRLQRECENNISLKLSETEDINAFEVFGRGELQLGILIETIRREGFEIAVSPPRVLTKKESDGTLMEPIEDVTIDCEIEYSGEIIEKLSKRKAVLTKMLDAQEGRCKMEFKCPTRGLIGFVPEMKNFTKGTAVLTHIFSGYEAFKGTVESSRKGCLISMTQGTTTTHALSDLESRGTLFIGPGTRVYSGMVIGECSRSLDIEVNPCREKILTNIRTICKEEFSRLVPPRQIPLEEMIAYMAGKIIYFTRSLLKYFL